ncbi:GNAT family protein [soil metagenome]
MKNFTLRSERLLLRNLKESDLDDFLLYRSDPEVTKYQGFGVFDKKKAEEFILTQKDMEFGLEGEWIQLGIILISENKLIGDCAVNVRSKKAQIGCTISKKYQRKGIAKETVLMLMKYLFEEFKVNTIIEAADEENIASLNLLKSIGFFKNCLVINGSFINGEYRNDIRYSLKKKEWEAFKSFF